MRLLAAALLFGVAGPLGAQEISADTASDGAQAYAPAGAAASLGSAEPKAVVGSIVLPARSETQLQQAIAAAEDDLRRADGRLSSAKERRFRSKAMVDQSRLDLRQVEIKMNEADKDKRGKSYKRQLETEKKGLERQKRWGEQLEAVDEAELEIARQASEVAFAKHQALGLESQLAQARSGAVNATGAKPLSGESSGMVVGQLELQTLEAQQKFRELSHELGRQEDDLAGMRLELYKSARK
jgi:hypothetical protein